MTPPDEQRNNQASKLFLMILEINKRGSRNRNGKRVCVCVIGVKGLSEEAFNRFESGGPQRYYDRCRGRKGYLRSFLYSSQN